MKKRKLTPPAQRPAKAPVSPPQARISAKLRQTIDLYTKERITKTEAAERIGINPSYLYSRLSQPHVKAYENERNAQYIQEIADLKEPYKAEAFETAADLMRNAKSESVRARMVEFLAGEKAQPTVNVGVNINNPGSGAGYEYVRPGQQVVEVINVTKSLKEGD